MLKIKISISFGLFIAGACCFILIFLLRDETRILVFLGSALWDSAFLGVLADNYKKRAPIPTRGGIVTYEENPRTYKFVYRLMVFIGAVFLVVITSLTASNR